MDHSNGSGDQGKVDGRQHIQLIANRYRHLGDLMDEAFEQLLLELGRSNATPSERLDLWLWARELPLPGSSTRMAKALGVSVGALVQWRKHGAPEDCGLHRGLFPVAYQILPRRGQPCVYLLFIETEVVYVGMSEHVRARLKAHTKDPRKEGITSWEVSLCQTRTEAEALEGDLIFQHQPRLNINGRMARRWAR